MRVLTYRRPKARKPRSGRYSWMLIAVICVGLVGWWFNSRRSSDSDKKPAQSSSSSEAEYGGLEQSQAIAFLNQLTAMVNPDLPENSYMPSELRSRLKWIYSEATKHHIDTVCEASITNPRGERVKNVFMASKWQDNGVAVIAVACPMLNGAAAVNGGVFPLTQEWKNYFAISLAHEVVHLENKEYWAGNNQFDGQKTMAEEFRTWILVSQTMINPLRAEGQPVGRDQILADDLIHNCNYRLPCEPFRRFLYQAYHWN